MANDNRNSAIAAAVILLVFGIGFYYLPSLMLSVGAHSTFVAGAIAVLAVAAFFAVFWLRGRMQDKSKK